MKVRIYLANTTLAFILLTSLSLSEAASVSKMTSRDIIRRDHYKRDLSPPLSGPVLSIRNVRRDVDQTGEGYDGEASTTDDENEECEDESEGEGEGNEEEDGSSEENDDCEEEAYGSQDQIQDDETGGEDDREVCDEEDEDDDSSGGDTSSGDGVAGADSDPGSCGDEILSSTAPTPTSFTVSPTRTSSTSTSSHTQSVSNSDPKFKQKSVSSSSSGSSIGKAFKNAFATFFYQNGVAGACGKVHQDSDLIAAIDSQMYSNGGNCGKQAIVSRKDDPSRKVTVKIVDECPTCQSGTSLDLSKAAFTSIASEAEGQVEIEWTWA